MWNWQKQDWPLFSYDQNRLARLETQFLYQMGILIGGGKHIRPEEKKLLLVELMSDEALKTSEIEGEYLDRDSVQSSILRQFGLKGDYRKVGMKEAGIAELMLDLYQSYSAPLTHDMLFDWHLKITNGRIDLNTIGTYRNQVEPMQIVSGPIGRAKIHFEAPPAKQIFSEMESFIKWFNDTAPDSSKPMSALTRAGLAHLYFVSIHPFEDGNGRIARALAQKVLFQSLGDPHLIALSHIIQANRKEYYKKLEENNKENEITPWLVYFAETVLKAEEHTLKMLEFLITKTKFYEAFKERLNERQAKVIQRLFAAGIEGFEGGLSAEKYIKITGASRATATRDLQDLTEKGILIRQGELKHTRYELNLNSEIIITNLPQYL